jgi:hypothetical protein
VYCSLVSGASDDASEMRSGESHHSHSGDDRFSHASVISNDSHPSDAWFRSPTPSLRADSPVDRADSQSSSCRLSSMSLAGIDVDSDRSEYAPSEGEMGPSESEDSIDGLVAGDGLAVFDDEPVVHAHVPKAKAELEAGVAGGVIRYYASSKTMVASCAKHGTRCRMTRGCDPKTRIATSGRPLGLLCTWLKAGLSADCDTQAEHCGMHASLFVQDDRMAARLEVIGLPGVADLLDKERARVGAELEELAAHT